MRTVVVTHFALTQINSIFEYYRLNISLKIAQKLKLEIITSIKTLKKSDVEWKEEEYLSYL